MIAALVSGGIAGLAGTVEIAGIHYHLVNQLSSGYGYTGIIAATLGGLNPIGVTVAALFISLISTGSQTVSRAMGVPVTWGMWFNQLYCWSPSVCCYYKIIELKGYNYG